MKHHRVALAIIYHDHRVLVGQRSDGDFEGLWEFPGGKVQEGETFEDAVRREIQEELDCDLQVVWELERIDHTYPNFTCEIACFVATLAPGAHPRCTVHRQLKWLNRFEMLDLDWLEADKDLVARISYFWDDIFQDEHL